MAKVQLNKVGKIYEDEFKAIHNIDLDIEDKEFIVFVGPSGCGKSTTLRMIAGLETISEGELRIGDEVSTTYLQKTVTSRWFSNHTPYTHI